VRDVVPQSSVSRLLEPSVTGWAIFAPLIVSFLLLAALVACSDAPSASNSAAETRKSPDLSLIPDADPSKYPKFEDMSGWKNPYFVVREDGIGFVDLQNREVRILKPEEIPAELVSLPSDAWPYGRVVLITEATAKTPSDQTKAEIRKNRALLVGTLKELDVQIREAP
jgi:hypothetical protein